MSVSRSNDLSGISGVQGGYAPLSSGLLVPTGYLGTGAASASTFLRGDGTWSAAVFSGARVYNSSNVSLSTATETALTFDSERYDTAAYHSTVTNTERLTVPVTGYYHIGAIARITNSPGDPSYILLQINGTTTIALDLIANNSNIPMGVVSCDYQLTAGDYVKVFVYVQSSSKNAVNNGNYSPEFWCHLIGS